MGNVSSSDDERRSYEAGKGKKRSAATAAENELGGVYKIEYAKSGRSKCRRCMQNIEEGEVRVSKKEFSSWHGAAFNGSDCWFHLECFKELRSILGFMKSAHKLPGFNLLDRADQAMVMERLGAYENHQKGDGPEAKRAKTGSGGFTPKQTKEYTKQQKIMNIYRKQLEHLSKGELISLLLENKNTSELCPWDNGRVDRMLNHLADCMTFGGFEPCPVCKKPGQMKFDKFGYRCSALVIGSTHCNTLIKEPKRVPFVVPEDLKLQYLFLREYKYVPRLRLIKDHYPTKDVEGKDQVDDPWRLDLY